MFNGENFWISHYYSFPNTSFKGLMKSEINEKSSGNTMPFDIFKCVYK